jgi:hypothetical protein
VWHLGTCEYFANFLGMQSPALLGLFITGNLPRSEELPVLRHCFATQQLYKTFSRLKPSFVTDLYENSLHIILTDSEILWSNALQNQHC